ncbi:MAG TPA: hypothetical protein VLA89_05035 [Gemmatimonadales bacterium]|nr:hypothetical protein [Gemmatimonadales bacterium]
MKSDGDSDFLTSDTTAANLKWHGTSVIFSTAASKKHFINAPNSIGTYKTIVCRKATTTLTAWVVLPTGWAFQKSSNSTGVTTRKLIFNSGAQSVVLQSVSTSKVAIIGNTNSVTVTTT